MVYEEQRNRMQKIQLFFGLRGLDFKYKQGPHKIIGRRKRIYTLHLQTCAQA